MNSFLTILLLICTLASMDIKAQSDDHNYVIKSSILDEQGQNSVTTIEYYDGLGRKEQVITNGVKPGYPSKALLSRTMYDGRGNEWKKILPVPTTGLEYQPSIAYKHNDQKALSAITYDVFDRPIFATTPGSDMEGRGKKHEYLANKANSVKKYIVSDDGTLSQKGYYLEGALSWERITDEDNNVTDIYTDLLGQKVLERQAMSKGMVDTYFVYNDCSKGAKEVFRSITTNNYDTATGILTSTDVATSVNGGKEVKKRTAALDYDDHGRICSTTHGSAIQTTEYDVRDWPRKLTSEVEDKANDITYMTTTNFIQTGKSPARYTYNANGGMETDVNNDIVFMEYDNFGYAKGIYFRNGSSIKYVHTPTGEKLKETYTTSVPNITKPVGLPFSLAPPEIQSVITKDYWGTDIICKNGEPQQFFFDGGFADIKGSGLTWHYYVKDHLGTNRIVQDEKGKVEATYNFYPFGGFIEHFEELYTHNISQPFTFQGKEYTSMYGLGMFDFGARLHAPLLGRWTSPDQLSEKYYSWSPYVFCLNNPARNTDTDGRIVETAWDAANVAMDATSFVANAAAGNYWSAAADGAAFIYDVTATAIPGLPGGAGAALKAYRASKVVAHTAQTAKTVLKATRYNYRSVLQKVTGKFGKGFEAHHTLPQKYRKQFEKLGINIDKPGNVVWREANGHRKKSNALTREWNDFMENKRPTTKKQIYQFRDKIEKKYFGKKSDMPTK